MSWARAAAIALPLAGLVACSGPASSSSSPAESRDIALPVDSQTIDARVPADSTMEMIFRRHKFSTETTGLLLQAVKAVFDPRSLRAHQSYRVTLTLDGLLREFTYQIDADRLLSVRRTSGGAGFSAEVVTLPKELRTEAIAVEIGKGQSLVGQLEAQGENVQLALELANIYGGEVDFNSDLQPGDHLECLFEREMRNGEFVGYGRVLAAVLQNDGRRLPAVLYPDSDGMPAYYDDDGRSLKRQFLKSPLPFDPRITSRFSYHRLHPVHGTVRAHLGVDLAAPYGTSVKAVASGVVEFVGMKGEAGRTVQIRHAGGYQTMYLHLSAFAPGLHPGSRVVQGDFVGRVGSSGTATGPHLDYRIIKNGTYVDPIAELRKMPKGEPIAAGRLAGFSTTRDDAMQQMASALANPAPRSPAAGSSR
ncbi:MAG TPA: peptidoglycan DD-metalloendopeptidase family protein [Vicinamibacterales bacterium]|nr:peptidoglycan DD-metalloendopeptidase family protein [Vicinamibacterales bacterium]